MVGGIVIGFKDPISTRLAFMYIFSGQTSIVFFMCANIKIWYGPNSVHDIIGKACVNCCSQRHYKSGHV